MKINKKLIQTELYEKEIKKLREENARLISRCENAEKYMNEYKELNSKSKKLIQEYQKSCRDIKKLENEYTALLNELINKSKEELRLRQE